MFKASIVQHPPKHPIVDVEIACPGDAWKFAEWIRELTVPPPISIGLGGSQFRFQTHNEILQFAFGLLAGLELYDEWIMNDGSWPPRKKHDPIREP